MKSILAGTLTAVFLTLMVYLGMRGPVREPDSPAPVEEAGPHPAEETVRNLIRFGDEGDVENYLESFVGRLRADLEREVMEKGRESFADELIRASSARKSHVVYTAEPENQKSARVVFEAVHADRNERQTYRVVRSSDDTWRISGVSEVKGRQPSSKFGAEVAPVEPDARTAETPPTPKVGLSVEIGEGSESP